MSPCGSITWPYRRPGYCGPGNRATDGLIFGKVGQPTSGIVVFTDQWLPARFQAGRLPLDEFDVSPDSDSARFASTPPRPRRRLPLGGRVFRLSLLILGWSLGLILIDDAKAAMPKRVIRMEVTAYCPCTLCCGPNAQGITACGKPVTHNRGRFVAADAALFNFGTSLSIPGYYGGQEVKVLDRGGAIKGNKLDVFFPTHNRARKWGRQQLDVTILEEF